MARTPRTPGVVSRLHSKNPADAAWRAHQAHVDADIEGMPRDPEIDRELEAIRAQGLGPEERIKRVVEGYKARGPMSDETDERHV